MKRRRCSVATRDRRFIRELIGQGRPAEPLLRQSSLDWRKMPTYMWSVCEQTPGRSRGMSKVIIYHNPACGTSRNVLAIIRETGIEPEVIQYLKTPPSKEKLRELVDKMGITVRELLREKGTPFAELGLADPKWS